MNATQFLAQGAAAPLEVQLGLSGYLANLLGVTQNKTDPLFKNTSPVVEKLTSGTPEETRRELRSFWAGVDSSDAWKLFLSGEAISVASGKEVSRLTENQLDSDTAQALVTLSHILTGTVPTFKRRLRVGKTQEVRGEFEKMPHSIKQAVTIWGPVSVHNYAVLGQLLPNSLSTNTLLQQGALGLFRDEPDFPLLGSFIELLNHCLGSQFRPLSLQEAHTDYWVDASIWASRTACSDAKDCSEIRYSIVKEENAMRIIVLRGSEVRPAQKSELRGKQIHLTLGYS